MKHILNGSLVGVLLLFFTVIPAKALPIISVDMDPITAGIQSALTVNPGATFTVDVLISDDGTGMPPTVFDTVILEASYNDLGNVLAPGPTGPVAGGLAANSFLTASIFGPPGTLIPGTTLLGTGPSSPAPGFLSGSGAIGLLDPLLFSVEPGNDPISIFSIDFVALMIGDSNILAAGTPDGAPELALGGVGIFATLDPGAVTVAPIPEPATIILLVSGMAGLGVFGRKRFRSPKAPTG